MSDRSKDECTADATPRVLMRCSRCKSPNVMRDAWAVWNAATQEWELGPIYDHSACDDCGAEGCIEEITPDGTPVPPDASLQQFVESIERAHGLQAADAAKESPRAIEVAWQLAGAATRTDPEPERERRPSVDCCDTEGCQNKATLHVIRAGESAWLCADCYKADHIDF